MGFFQKGLALRLGERWVLLVEAVEFAVVFLELLLAESVDDFGSWVDAFVGEAAFDLVSVGFEFGVWDLRVGSLQSFHG